MDRLDVVVIGAGVVGLAVARALALQGREVIVLESESEIGSHTSSRNSEVIHAGIYYPPGTLKARTCLAGQHLLYQYCAERNIPHKRLGKLVVATNEAELPQLNDILERAAHCGVQNLQWLDQQEVTAKEPEIVAAAGIFSPDTGIVDSHQLMLSFQGDLESAKGGVILESPVLGGTKTDRGIELQVGGISDTNIVCNSVINCAGLWAPDLAALLGTRPDSIPRASYARGHYYSLAGKSPFSHLIYPIPHTGGLGIHATLDLGGQVKFGPDVEWADGVDYTFTKGLEENFRSAIKQYYPTISERTIQPGYCGIRPKIVAENEASGDFVIADESAHGTQGLINLYGIESPGLTAAMAIAQKVSEKFMR